jgi:Inclusion body protein
MGRHHPLLAMLDIIAVLADGRALSPNPERPGEAAHDSVCLLTTGAGAVPTSRRRLILDVSLGDQLVWRSRAQAASADYCAILYSAARRHGARALGPARAVADDIPQPIPDPANPVDYAAQQQFDYHLETPVAGFGALTLRLGFCVVQRRRSALTTLGYVYWDAPLVLEEAEAAPGS